MVIRNMRQGRIFEVEKIISDQNEAGLGFDKEILISKLSYQLGNSRRTIIEYINTLKSVGRIVELEGKFWTAAHYHALETLEKEQSLKEKINPEEKQ